MEYTLKLTVSPTDHEGTMMARVFVNKRDDGAGSETVEVWSHPLCAEQPLSDQDPIQWAARLLGATWEKCFVAWAITMDRGQEKSMDELFIQ